jgi:hypothetical protein
VPATLKNGACIDSNALKKAPSVDPHALKKASSGLQHQPTSTPSNQSGLTDELLAPLKKVACTEANASSRSARIESNNDSSPSPVQPSALRHSNSCQLTTALPATFKMGARKSNVELAILIVPPSTDVPLAPSIIQIPSTLTTQSIASSHSHRQKRNRNFTDTSSNKKTVSTRLNRKARCKQLQMLWDDGTVATQPNLPYNNALVASTVTPTKQLHNSNLDKATSDLSEDEYSTVTSNIRDGVMDSEATPKPSLTSRRSQVLHAKQQALESPPACPQDVPQSDANGPEFNENDDSDSMSSPAMVRDHNLQVEVMDSAPPKPSVTSRPSQVMHAKKQAMESPQACLQDVPQSDVNGPEFNENDDSHSMSSPAMVRNHNPQDSVINPRLPKPSIKYETISVYND